MNARVLCLIATSVWSCDRPPPALDGPPVAATTQAAPAAPAPRVPRPFIDTHTHMNSFAYELLFDRMAPLGLRRVINLSGGSAFDGGAESLAAADATQGGVLLFHNIEWDGIDDPDFGQREADRLEASVRLGYAGMKISKALGLGVRTADGKLVPVDDARLDPIWARASKLGVPVAIHTSDPKAFFEPPTETNERYGELSLAPGWSFYGDEFPSREDLLAARDRMVAKHPGTTFILVHLGNNPEDPSQIDALLSAHPNAYVDIAARVGEFGRHDAAQMRSFFERHADRVFFATDMMMGVVPGPLGQPRLRLTLGSISTKPPDLDDVLAFYETHFRYFESTGTAIDHPVPIQGDWKVNPIGLDDSTLDKLYWRNAERVIVAPSLGRRAAFAVVAQSQLAVSKN